MEKETIVLKEQNLKLQEQITLLEKASQQQISEKSQCEETIVKLREEISLMKGIHYFSNNKIILVFKIKLKS